MKTPTKQLNARIPLPLYEAFRDYVTQVWYGNVTIAVRHMIEQFLEQEREK